MFSVIFQFLIAIFFVLYLLVTSAGQLFSNVFPQRSPAATASYQAVMSTVPAPTSTDKLLKDTLPTEPFHDGRDLSFNGGPLYYPKDCIVADGYRLYGTDRSYEQVVADYAAAFEHQSGWRITDNNRHFISDTTDIDVSDSGFEVDEYRGPKYKTLYVVRISFNYPSQRHCALN